MGTTVVKLTMLSSMADAHFEPALEKMARWDIDVLDLKDGIFGRNVTDLTDEEAARARQLIDAKGMSVHCLSTGLFSGDIEDGEAAFEKHRGGVARIIEIARVLRPHFIRLMSASCSRRGEIADSAAYIGENCPWLIGLYSEAIDAISDAGFAVTIENGIGGSIFANPSEILRLFEMLRRRGRVSLTWDVQNLWLEGTFPSLGVYRALKPLIGYVHLKGGMAEAGGTALRWLSTLEDASWPVLEITRQVVADGTSPVICLNDPHGDLRGGYDGSDIAHRDLEFLRRCM
ncbi:MAG: TIM barrel protein [Phycisphaerae bacterium]|nr:TIM barrel protein [Phycisphaerae bacterium]